MGRYQDLGSQKKGLGSDKNDLGSSKKGLGSNLISIQILFELLSFLHILLQIGLGKKMPS